MDIAAGGAVAAAADDAVDAVVPPSSTKDEDAYVMTVTKMVFVKQRSKNAYHAFATLPGYGPTLGDHDKANDPYWQPWKINEDLHDCMRTYYETEEGKGDNVKVFNKGDDCQSEEE